MPFEWCFEVVQIILKNDGPLAWPKDCALSCCFGTGFGCERLPMDGVQPGEGVHLSMELEAKDAGVSAWVLSSGDDCFGPVFLAEASFHPRYIKLNAKNILYKII